MLLYKVEGFNDAADDLFPASVWSYFLETEVYRACVNPHPGMVAELLKHRSIKSSPER